MYRARAARAGPEPGSPGRFGILSTGQLRDLLQDEPKLDRIVRLSRKVTRGARARGGCWGVERTGRGLRGPGDPASGGHPPWSCQASGSWEPGTSEWAPRSRPRGMGGAPILPGAGGAGGGAWGCTRAPRDGREACPPEDAPGRCVLGGGRWRVSCVVGGPGSAHPRSLGPERGGALLGEELKACLTPGAGG